MASKIRFRRDTEENWNLINPVLQQGEPGYNLTNQKLKIGDGSLSWDELPYLETAATSIDWDDVTNKPAIPVDISDLSDNSNVLDNTINTGDITFTGNVISSSDLSNDTNGIVLDPGDRPFIIGPGTFHGGGYRGLSIQYNDGNIIVSHDPDQLGKDLTFYNDGGDLILECGYNVGTKIKLDPGTGGVEVSGKLYVSYNSISLTEDKTYDGWDESSNGNIFSVTPIGDDRILALGDPEDGKVWTFINSSNSFSVKLSNNPLAWEENVFYTLLPETVVTVTKNPSGQSWKIVSEYTSNTIPFGTRIVTAPTSSVGASGDQEGDVAFNNDYIYRCIADYEQTQTILTSIVSTGSPASYLTFYSPNTPPADMTSLTISGPSGYTGTVTGASIDQGAGQWQVPVSPDVSQVTGVYTFGTQSDIWKRVAWSNDTTW